MKRFLSTFFITLALIIGAAGAAPAAHAEDPCPVDSAGNQSILSSDGECHFFDNNGAEIGTPVEPTFEEATLTDPAAEKTSKTYDAPPTTPEASLNGIMAWIASLFAWLAGVAMITLNYAVYFTVVTMGNYVNNLSAVGVTWQIMRDIGNIVIIFGFLVAGIATIIKYDMYGWGRTMLPKLLIAAVFLNFSLFLTEAIIDTGNLFATQFYTQINGGNLPTSATLGSQGVSDKIMNQLGLTTIYGGVKTQSAALYKENPMFIGFMSIILFIILAFVLFSLAFILIARFVILLFLIIIAPIGFAGLAVPKLESTAKKWWSALFEQTITAPVLLLLLYIALAIITDANFLTSGGKPPEWLGLFGKDGATNIAGFATAILSFLVAMGLLLAVVIISKKMSAFGAGMATKAAGALSFGAVALGGRATLGMIGVGLANKRMQAAARRGGLGGLALKTLVLGGKGLRSSTYDFRNAPGFAKGSGLLNVETGEGAKLTAKQVHEAQYGWKPTKEWFDQSKAEREQAGREIDFKNAQADLAAGRITQAQHDAIVVPILSKMSTKQLEELGGIKKGVDALVNNLSPQQFEALMKSDKLNDIEKDKIKDARYRTLSGAVSSGNVPAIKKAVNSLSKGELESMPAAMLANPLVLGQLSDKQRETINDSKERTAAEKDLVRNSSPTGSVEAIFNAAGGGVTGAVAVAGSPNFARLTVPQLAKLDKAILTQPAVAEKLTTATLIELQEQKKLTPPEMITIGNHIRASATANAKTKDYVTTGPGSLIWA